MTLDKSLPHDDASGPRAPDTADIQDALNATAVAIRRSTARMSKAESVMRRCDATVLTDRQTVERARQLLART